MEVVSYNRYAGFIGRLLAFLIDRICLMPVLCIFWGFKMFFYMMNIWVFLPLELVVIAYYVICETSAWQGTLGKHLLGMKVVTEQYGRLRATDAIIRYLSKYLSFFAFCLGYLWIIIDPKKQGWHDKIAGTYVIEA